MCERERRAYSPLAQTEGFMCILISWYPQNVCILCYLGSSHAHQLQKNLVDFGAMSIMHICTVLPTLLPKLKTYIWYQPRDSIGWVAQYCPGCHGPIIVIIIFLAKKSPIDHQVFWKWNNPSLVFGLFGLPELWPLVVVPFSWVLFKNIKFGRVSSIVCHQIWFFGKKKLLKGNRKQVFLGRVSSCLVTSLLALHALEHLWAVVL